MHRIRVADKLAPEALEQLRSNETAEVAVRTGPASDAILSVRHVVLPPLVNSARRS